MPPNAPAVACCSEVSRENRLLVLVVLGFFQVTIVVAIHQPRPEVWRLFDHAILLSGGRTVFCGPADEALGGTTR